MAMWKNFLGGLRGLFRKEQTERELDEELRDYEAKSAAEKMREGMSAADAHRAARMQMGGREVVKEKVRDASWETVLETVWSDLRFGARLLRFNPVFAAAAILSLALGIGANTAIFQLLDAVRMRTLPVKNPQELATVKIDGRNGTSGNASGRFDDVTYALWEQIREHQEGFSSVFAWGGRSFNVSPAGEVHRVQGLWVSGEFFGTLDVAPAVGRLLDRSDDQPACGAASAVISYSFWQHEYAADRSVAGRTILIDRHPFKIIGVAAPDFYGVEMGRYFDVALPLCSEPTVDGSEEAMLPQRDYWWLDVMGRLKPGWTLERASAQLRAISPGLFEATLPPNFNARQAKRFEAYRLKAFPGGAGVSELRESYEQPLWLLLALAGLVLLIASANLANLLLARASAREHEMGMRMAVGAGRGRLIRQLLAESVLLAVIGGLLGAALARVLSQILVASLSTKDNPLFVDLGMDWRVLGFTTGLAVLTCLLFGLAPALRATRVSPIAALRQSGRGTTQGPSRFGLRRVLVVCQIALSLMLLVGALLFARSLAKLTTLDAGFRRDGILLADVDFTLLNLPPEQRITFSHQLLERVRAIPGVDAAASAEMVPLSGDAEIHDILPGVSGAADEHNVAVFNQVSPEFFRTLQTPILAGRDFNEHDVKGGPLVVIVNETFARKYVKDSNPVGTMFRIRRMNQMFGPYQIVGLVRDTKYMDLREDPWAIVYRPLSQNDKPNTDAEILIRSNAPLAAMISGVKDVANEAHAGLNVSFMPFHQMINNGLLRDRLMARLSGFFGVLAVVLAEIGLYGVISYMVARRRNEIGIRMSLGASRGSIVTLVLRESVLLLSVGLGIGIGLALASSHAAGSLLFGLKPYDAATLLTAAALLAVVALAASYVPAMRAARVEPVEALRHE
jgi:putative ABC transport system permease protein